MDSLLKIEMHDGSRHFAILPANQDWYRVRDHLQKLPGASLTGILCDDVTEAWIDFVYKSHTFTINDQFGEYWFFCKDPNASESILGEVKAHWETLLG